ncbi:MAG TPA: hypothetical protein VFU15_03505, partial [Bacteroidia bacterium]|nr:hypothetical protein [Bacteroidia bacterium]
MTKFLGIEGLNKVKSLFNAIAVIVAPFSIATALVLWIENKNNAAIAVLWWHNSYFIWLLLATIFLMLSTILYLSLSSDKSNTIRLGAKTEKKKTGSMKNILRVAVILGVVNFFLALFFYGTTKFNSEQTTGILGITYSNSEFQAALQSFLRGKCGENELQFTDNQRAIEDIKYQDALFATYFQEGLLYYGHCTKVDSLLLIDCTLKWHGQKHTDIDTNQTIPSSVYRNLDDYSLKIRTNAKIISDFILGYYYVHYSDSSKTAIKYFQKIINDSIFQAAIRSRPKDEDLQAFNKDLQMFQKYAELLVTDQSKQSAVVPCNNGELWQYSLGGKLSSYQGLVKSTQEFSVDFYFDNYNTEYNSYSGATLVAAINSMSNPAFIISAITLQTAVLTPEERDSLSERQRESLEQNRTASVRDFIWRELLPIKKEIDIGDCQVSHDIAPTMPWPVFQEAISKTNVEDKDVILSVLSKYPDGEKREAEIRNMAATYRGLPQILYTQAQIHVVIKGVELWPSSTIVRNALQ